MKQIIILIFLFFSNYFIIAQTPEQQKLNELKAQLTIIQLKGDSLMKALQKGKVNQPTGDPQLIISAKKLGSGLNSFERIKLSLPDTSKIRLMPKKTLSVDELAKYLVDLYKIMRLRFPAGAIRLADDIAKEVGNNPQKLEAAASVAWLNGYTEEAALLIVEGASHDVNDGLLLTNAGAILDLAGIAYKAVPILRTLVSINPENAIANNNLGQAYCGLGLHDSAMMYLKQCIKLSPEHPEANNTAGFIEYKRGNKMAAKTYFENAIRGGFTNTAYQGLKSLDKNNKDNWKIKKLIMPKITYPEYFNQYKFKLPKQCKNIGEAEEVESGQRAFIKMIGKARTKYELLARTQAKTFANSIQDLNIQTAQKAKVGKAYMRPFQVMATVMVHEIFEEHYSQKPTALSRFNENNRMQLKKLYSEYEKKLESVGSDCKATNTLKNNYLPQFAALNQDWQIKNMHEQQKFLEEILYWQPMAAISKADADFRFYNFVKEYLVAVDDIARQNIILKSCDESSLQEGEDTALVLKDFECPVTLSKSIGIADFKMECDKLSIGVHFLVANFKVDRNIRTRQSTISIGIGDNLYNKGLGFGGVNAGATADVGMSLFLTMDAGGITDGGMQYSASASAGVAFEKGEKLKFSKEINKVSIGGSYRIGISSGLSISDAEGKDLLAPTPGKQINKNVKVYPQK